MQRILAVLAAKTNLSTAEISAEAFVGFTTLACGGYIKALKKQKLVFISGWRQVKGRFSTPLYSLGNSADMKRPRVDDSNRDAPGMRLILDVLHAYGPLTHQAIAEHSGLSPHTVKNSGYLSALIAQGKVYIHEWRRAKHGPMSPVYRVGAGSESSKPSPLSGPEKTRRYRERQIIRRMTCSTSAYIALLAKTLPEFKRHNGLFLYLRTGQGAESILAA